MTRRTPAIPSWTPPPWLNAMMAAMLRTPGLQRLVGRTTALITVTGRTTGRRYTTPVTYDRVGDTVVILTKRPRTWWRNLPSRPEVELRLAGTTVQGRAHVSVDDPERLPDLVSFLKHRRGDAKAYGIAVTDGHVDEDDARAVLPHIVVITVTTDPAHRQQSEGVGPA